LIEQVTGS